MTLLYYDDIYLEHETGRHPECADRLRVITRHLRSLPLWGACCHIQPPDVSPQRLQRIHHPDHCDQMRRVAESGGGRVEADTQLSRGSYQAAIRAAGAACDAVQRVVAGDDQTALALVRPPGHHALRSAPMGFCLFNNIAVAAEMAVAELDLARVLIVDWDVHHGNGTQDAFWESERVAFYSVHRFPFYPGSGAADETGAGKGRGATCNVPVEFGTSRKEYFSQVESSLSEFADRWRPELILVSAGFDSHRLDPIGSLGLETEDFARLTQFVLDLARNHAQGRLVSLLEGGYSLEALPGCVEQHLTQLLASNPSSD